MRAAEAEVAVSVSSNLLGVDVTPKNGTAAHFNLDRVFGAGHEPLSPHSRNTKYSREARSWLE